MRNLYHKTFLQMRNFLQITVFKEPVTLLSALFSYNFNVSIRIKTIISVKGALAMALALDGKCLHRR